MCACSLGSKLTCGVGEDCEGQAQPGYSDHEIVEVEIFGQ